MAEPNIPILTVSMPDFKNLDGCLASNLLPLMPKRGGGRKDQAFGEVALLKMSRKK